MNITTSTLFLLLFLSNSTFAQVITQLSITPSEENLRISWEMNIDFSTVCVVEKSDDAKHFTPLATLQTGIFDEGYASYSVEDESVVPGIDYFYRIRYKDESGNFQQSETLSANIEREILLVGEFFPNPTYTGHVSIECRALENCEVELSVISTQGIELFSGKQNFLMGDHVMDLNFPEIPPGLYFVKMETAEWIRFKGFVVE
ncbi:MAG: hypothetical protein R3D00_17955 [Bacteroidia bacterium]